MAKVKIYSSKDNIMRHRATLSASIHRAIVSALEYPSEKKLQRFISLDSTDFIFPSDRSHQYVIVEISKFAGRSENAKSALIRELFSNIHQDTGISTQDIEITIFETPVKTSPAIRILSMHRNRTIRVSQRVHTLHVECASIFCGFDPSPAWRSNCRYNKHTAGMVIFLG